jgi:hemoglobin
MPVPRAAAGRCALTRGGPGRVAALYLEALDEAGLPDHEPFREAVRSHLEFGTQVAQQSSNAETDAELHPLLQVQRWTWPGDSDE